MGTTHYHTYKNIPEMFFDRAHQLHGRAALKVKSDGHYTDVLWKNLAQEVAHVAHGLLQLGVHGDQRVAIIAESRPEWIYADMALLSLGAVTVPVFPTYKRREVEYILNHSEARIIIISNEKQWEKVSRLKKRFGTLCTIVTFESFPCNEELLLFDDIKRAGEKDLYAHKNMLLGRIKRIQGDDLATIIYTSGTTGPPKGVMLTHRNFLSNCEGSADVIAAKKGDVALSALPLSHVFERLAGYYMYFYVGVTIAYAEGLNTLLSDMKLIHPDMGNLVPRIFEKFYHKLLGKVSSLPRWRQSLFYWAMGIGKMKYVYELKKQKCPIWFFVGYVVARLLVFNKIRKEFGGKIRFFIAGGAKLSREIARFFYAADILILEGYGLTETSPVIAVNRVDKNRFGTVGIPLSNIHVHIADDGEILVKGPSIMKGYYKDDALTNETIRDGWLYTGDIGLIDENGFLKITGRKKDIIVTSSGKNVSPQNIENRLSAHQYINQVFVCGDGEKYISALIVPDFEQIEQFAYYNTIIVENRKKLLERKEIVNLVKQCIDEINGELPDYERIKKFALLDKEFTLEEGELTPTLKVKRSVIMTRYRNIVNRLYGRD